MEQAQQEPKKAFLHGITWGKAMGLIGIIVGAIIGEVFLGNLSLGSGIGLVIGIMLGWIVDKKKILSGRPTSFIIIAIFFFATIVAVLTFLVGSYIYNPLVSSQVERNLEKYLEEQYPKNVVSQPTGMSALTELEQYSKIIRKAFENYYKEHGSFPTMSDGGLKALDMPETNFQSLMPNLLYAYCLSDNNRATIYHLGFEGIETIPVGLTFLSGAEFDSSVSNPSVTCENGWYKEDGSSGGFDGNRIYDMRCTAGPGQSGFVLCRT